MAHSDLHLVRAILKSGDLQTPQRMGINRDTFLTQDGKIAFDIIDRHYSSPEHLGQVPSTEAFRCTCPIVFNKLPEGEMTIVEACEIALEAAQSQTYTDMLSAAIQEKRVTEGVEILRAGIDRIMTFNTKDKVHDFGSEAYSHVMDEYLRIKNGGGMVGYPWPKDWDVLNTRTGGIEKGMYVVIHGRPGNMKSYILCKLAVHFLQETKLRVYFFNNEMTTEKLITRLALIYAGISSRRYRKGLLTQAEEVRLAHRLGELYDMTAKGNTPGRIAISDPSWSRTVHEMSARLQEHRSHICLLDGAYLMMTTRGQTAEKPEHATRISREIQRQSVSSQIPHIVSTQTGRKAEEQSIAQRIQTVDNIGYADAWGQDAAFVIAVMLGQTELTMLFPKVREDEKCVPITINANPGEDFSYKGDYVSTELYETETKKRGNGRQENANPRSIANIDAGYLRNSLTGE